MIRPVVCLDGLVWGFRNTDTQTPAKLQNATQGILRAFWDATEKPH